MIKIIGDRDSGKTKDLLTLCGETQGVYVCKHPERVAAKCLSYNIPIVQAEPYYYMLKWAATRKDTPVYLDDVDEFLLWLAEGNIQGFTLTKD